jgi:hypothetical protein
MWCVWGRGEVCIGFWWGNLRARDHWGDPDTDGRIILRWIFRRGLSGMDGVGSGKGQVAGTCEYGEELSGSKNVGNFLTSCRTNYLLKQDSAPRSK